MCACVYMCVCVCMCVSMCDCNLKSQERDVVAPRSFYQSGELQWRVASTGFPVGKMRGSEEKPSELFAGNT